MLELLITYLRATFGNSFQNITEVHGLAELIQEPEKTYPKLYCTGGDYKNVGDLENYIYFRQTGPATEAESDEEAVSGCDHYITRTYPMIAVAYIPKNVFGTDNAFIDGKVANNIANIIRVANYGTLLPATKADNIYAEIKDIDTNRNSVWNREFRNVEMAARLDHVYCSVEFNLIVEATESCLTNYDCNDAEVVIEGDTIVINFSDQNAWHQTGDTIGDGKKIGSLNNQNWDVIHNDVIIATVKATGIDINGLLAVNGGVSISGALSVVGIASVGSLSVGGNASVGGNLSVTGSINYASGAIQSLNGLTAKVQTFATGSTGIDFNIVSAGTVHTFNIPDASLTARGLVSTGSQSFVGIKSFLPVETATGINNLLYRFGGQMTSAFASVSGLVIDPRMIAGVNNQTLRSVFINPALTAGAFTGLSTPSLVVTRPTNNGEVITVLSANGLNAVQLRLNANSGQIDVVNSPGNTIETRINGAGMSWINASRINGVGLGTNNPAAMCHVIASLNTTALLVQTSVGNNYVQYREVAGVRQAGYFGVTPVPRQVVPTGSSTDAVITALQNLGFFSQT